MHLSQEQQKPQSTMLTSKSTQAYSPGAGVVPFLYSSEIFPQVLRGKPRASCTDRFPVVKSCALTR